MAKNHCMIFIYYIQVLPDILHVEILLSVDLNNGLRETNIK